MLRSRMMLSVGVLALLSSGAWAACPASNTYPFTANCPLPAAKLNAILAAVISAISARSLVFINAQKDHGATGDNATDDGPALAAALAACDATHPVYLPPGQYKTRQALTAPAYCKVFGDFGFSYLYTETRKPAIIADNTNGAFTTAGISPSGAAVLTLSEASQLVGVAVFGDHTAGHADAVRVAGPFVKIDRAGIFEGGTANLYCYNASPLAQGLQLTNTLIGASAGYGVYNLCADSNLQGNYIFTSANAGLVNASTKTQMIGNTVEWNGSGYDAAGVLLYFPNDQFGTILSDNHIVDNYGPGLYLQNAGTTASQTSVIGNNFYNNGRNDVANTNCHVKVDGAFTGAMFAGNSFGVGTSGTRPAYVWCGSSPSFDSTSRINDGFSAQATGVYLNATVMAGIQGAIGHTPGRTCTASASSACQFTGLIGDEYRVRCYGIVPGTDNVNALIQFGQGATPTWLSANYQWASLAHLASAPGTVAGGASTSGSSITLNNGGQKLSNTGTRGSSFTIDVHNLGVTGTEKTAEFKSFVSVSGGGMSDVSGAGSYTGNTDPVVGLRIAMDAGTFSGTCVAHQFQ